MKLSLEDATAFSLYVSFPEAGLEDLCLHIILEDKGWVTRLTQEPPSTLIVTLLDMYWYESAQQALDHALANGIELR